MAGSGITTAAAAAAAAATRARLPDPLALSLLLPNRCVQKFDRKSSSIAFGSPGKFLLCACAPFEGAPVVELV